jgi:hypothetical protein
MGVFNKKQEKESIEDVDVMKDIEQKKIQLALTENETIQQLVMQIAFEGIKGHISSLTDAMIDMKLKAFDTRLKDVEAELVRNSYNQREPPTPIPKVYKSVEKEDYAQEEEEESEELLDLEREKQELEKKLRVLKMQEGRMRKQAMGGK